MSVSSIMSYHFFIMRSCTSILLGFRTYAFVIVGRLEAEHSSQRAAADILSHSSVFLISVTY